MKGHAKLYKAQSQRTVQTLSKRLQHEEVKDDELMRDDRGIKKKKMKLRDDTAMKITNPPPHMMKSSANPK